ncbi:AEC family transporter [Desemzia sp. RIT804]|uniref:AEC family transporter n=1 Tax=Desemzia sp. RIT 804 TaxID=2810209 RepID=UPI0019511B95|nr:AEC family transporter [Desemzia sp. RIT 804]MBM6614503.1 AEC family transporter [Desemzia sp. RIT 804]
MNITAIIIEQMGIMFLLIFFGYFLMKKNVLTSEGTQQIAGILTKYITPIILINSFTQKFESNQINLLLLTMGVSLLLLISRAFLNQFLFKKDQRIDKFAATFSNSNFMGIPLVMSVLGYEGVFFMTGYMVVSTTFQWTYGIYTVTGDKRMVQLRNALLNPAFIGLYVGLFFYLTQIPLPYVVSQTFNSLSSLNTPLAMILLGSYIANSHLWDIFNSKAAYWTTALRLILYPLVGTLILQLLPLDNYLILMVLTIASAAPSAINTALFSQIYGGDYQYGARIVILSTLLSIITLPINITIANAFFS